MVWSARGGSCWRWRGSLGGVISTGLIAALVGGCGSEVVGRQRGVTSRPVRRGVSTLAAVPIYAYPAIATVGSSGFVAVWDGKAGLMAADLSAPGGAWSGRTRLSGGIVDQSGARVAGSRAGASAVVWANGSAGVAQARYRISPQDAWQPLATLFSSRHWAVSSPEVGMDDRGDAFAAWGVGNGAIDVAEHPAGADSWLPATTVAQDPLAGLLGFAVGRSGTVALAWTRSLAGAIKGPGRSELYVSVRPADQGTWRSPARLGVAGTEMLQNDGPPPFLAGPQAAVNGRDDVFVVWQWPHRGTLYPRVAGLTWTGHRYRSRMVALPRSGLDPVIAADGRGSTTVLWQRPKRIDSDLWEADVSSRARVLGVRRMGHGSDAMLASNDRGDLVAAWTGPDRVAARPAGGRWCRQISVQRSSGSEPPRVAIASTGVSQVIWQQASDTKIVTAVDVREVTRCR